MRQPRAYTIDLRHYLDDQGEFAELPAPALRLATFFGAIAAWMSRQPAETMDETNVACIHRPAHRACLAFVFAQRGSDDRIDWECLACRERGIISGWVGSPWDRSLGAGSDPETRVGHVPDHPTGPPGGVLPRPRLLRDDERSPSD